LTLSSLGVGSYYGAPDEIGDLKLFNAIIESVLSGGCNVIDSAINFRYQKSERTIGAALRYLSENHKVAREELWIGSKAGYVPVL
jgi:aryl-alcohol dehydrogenase-like predicted oxidoreductase